jgi:hypothetical protein
MGGSGSYVGYDAEAGGAHAIRIQGDRGTQIIRGQMLSNSGVAPGDRVVWTPGGVGGQVNLRVMPR